MKAMAFLAALLFAVSGSASEEQAWGYFSGQVVAKWITGGDGSHRCMELIEAFRYVGPDKVVWDAPKGSIVDGASIPRLAWTVIGGPYEGAYREASVIHDVACVRRDRRWQDVHRAFYTAMRAANVDAGKAKIMYGAVYHFGPRWGICRSIDVPPSTKVQLDDQMKRIKLDSGIGMEVVQTKGSWTTDKSDDPPEIVGAVIEVRHVQPPSSEDAFKKMQESITAEMSLKEIEALPVDHQP